MDFRILVPRNNLFGACPKCKEELTLERVKSSGKWEKFYLSLFGLKKYHCKKCKWYGKLYIYALARNIKKVLINYLIIGLIIIVVSLIFRFIIKDFLNP
jgi:hypothetical protein